MTAGLENQEPQDDKKTITFSSLLSCYACGIDEKEPEVMDMKRASVSRRSEHIQSPQLRSRSSERALKSDEENFMDAVENYNDDERVETNRKRTDSYHRRAMSDPFDAQEFEDAKADDNFTPSKDALPTFPRYPIADNRNKNCWGQPDVNIFHVRGNNYFVDSKKIPSAPYLLQARGVDLFLSESNNNLLDQAHLILNGHLRKLPTLLINFQFPWGHMVLYFHIPSKLVPFMRGSKADMNNFSTQEKVLAKWLQGNQEYRNERLKLIPYVAEGPWVVRNMVTGRPALIGKKLKVSYKSIHADDKGADLLMCTLDIGSGSSTAKRIVSVCRRYMSSLTVDVGFLIEAKDETELPEQMMGSLRIYHPDPLKAVKLA